MSENISIEICNLINEPFFITDSYGLILAANHSTEKLLGKGGSLIGKNIREIQELSSLWPVIVRSKGKGEEVRERVLIGGREYEASIHHEGRIGGFVYTGILLYEVSQYLSIEKELLKRNRELMIINTLSGTFIASSESEKIFSDLLKKVLLITDFSIGLILVKEESGFVMKGHQGVSLEMIREIEEGKLDAFLEEQLHRDEPMYIFERDDIARYPILLRERLSFLGIIPLFVGKEFLGLLVLGSRSDRSFDFDLASMMSLVGNQVSLILEKIQLFEKTRHLSITDALTELYNVRYFYRALTNEIERSKRYGETFSLIIFDLDDFKVVNDTYGHQIGDDVLKEFSSILVQHSRKSDTIARYGGEEFVLILPKTDKDEATRIADRICKIVRQREFQAGESRKIAMTVSGGVSTFPEDGDTPKELLYVADMALYEAKSSGKNQVKCLKKGLGSLFRNEVNR